MQKKRRSNMELLRIIAMLLVLVIHADFKSLNYPTIDDLHENIMGFSARVYIQSISLTCVNIFILISGWFGIKPSIKGFSNFVFQWLFYAFGIYLFFVCIGKEVFSFKGLFNCLNFLKGAYWFIGAYSLLYILSPFLNAGINTMTRCQLKNFIIVFYIFAFFYSWFFKYEAFGMGYSALSFVGLYVIARYANVYHPRFLNYPCALYCALFLLFSFCDSILYVISINYNMWGLRGIASSSYDNPFVILSSLTLLLLFSKINFQSNIINWIAKSSFAVYLLHGNVYLIDYYTDTVKKIYANFSGLLCLIIIGLFVLVTFIASVSVDQIRKKLWYFINSKPSANPIIRD